jgi:hypothetical protein
LVNGWTLAVDECWPVTGYWVLVGNSVRVAVPSEVMVAHPAKRVGRASSREPEPSISKPCARLLRAAGVFPRYMA